MPGSRLDHGRRRAIPGRTAIFPETPRPSLQRISDDLGPLEAFGVCERRDDVCATADLCARKPQTVPALDLPGALAEIARLTYERPTDFERALAPMIP